MHVTEGQARVAPRDVRQLVLERISELDRAERAAVWIEPDHGARENQWRKARQTPGSHGSPLRDFQRLHPHRLGSGHCRAQATPEAHARPGELQASVLGGHERLVDVCTAPVGVQRVLHVTVPVSLWTVPAPRRRGPAPGIASSVHAASPHRRGT